MVAANVPNITLLDGAKMPQLGLGVHRIDDATTVEVVTSALEVGYRSIDTAAIYGNERGVGEALATSGLPRDQLFITSKVWNTDQGYDATIRAANESLDRLKLDHLDLYLIHWPMPFQDTYVETWKAMIALQEQGMVNSIGVSNFEEAHLRRVIEATDVSPVVNQVELHPRHQRPSLISACRGLGIQVEAWAPLGEGSVLDEATLRDLGARYDRSVAQVVLRWHLQHDRIAIPKSVRPERLAENFDVFGFELEAADMETIDAMERAERLGPDPLTFGR